MPMTPEQRQHAETLARLIHRQRKDLRVDASDIAQALDGDETVVSRVLSDQYGVKLSKLGAFLHALGLRVIPATANIRELPEEHYQSLVVFAEVGAEAMRRGDIHPKFHSCRLDPCGPVRVAPSGGGASPTDGALHSTD